MIISILIVLRNAKDNIINCIQSIESQFQEGNQEWELIIVDGMSDDGSKDVATQYLKNKPYSWLVVDNPKKILASGWNIGIKVAKGKYVLRPDVHATLHQGYIQNGLTLLAEQPSVTAVGRFKPKPVVFGERLSPKHYHQKLAWEDPHFEQMQRMALLITVVWHLQEINIWYGWLLLTRILNGIKTTICMIALKKWRNFYLFGQMKANYYCRSTIFSLAKQMGQNGFYLTQLPVKKLRLRHLMPLIFYTSLATVWGVTFLMGQFETLPWVMLAGYLSVIGGFPCVSIKKMNLEIWMLLGVIPIMHMAYALGMFGTVFFNF